MRVLCYEGLLRKHSSETLLSSVTDVKLTVPALGGMFGYGDLTILTASGAEGSDKFTTIRRAAEFRTALQSGTDRRRRRAGRASPVAGRRSHPRPQPPAAARATGHRRDAGSDRAVPRTVAPAAAATTSDDAAASLERLADLHARGVITDAEFEAKKAELLGRI